MICVEIPEAQWTEEVRALTQSVSLAGAVRTPRGTVVATVDVSELPPALALIAVSSKTLLQQVIQQFVDYLGDANYPLEHLRFLAKIADRADWATINRATAYQAVMDYNFGVGWETV